MSVNDMFRVAGEAVKVAQLAEEFIEFVMSLGPEMLERLTETYEFYDLREAVEEYVQVRDTTEVVFE